MSPQRFGHARVPGLRTYLQRGVEETSRLRLLLGLLWRTHRLVVRARRLRQGVPAAPLEDGAEAFLLVLERCERLIVVSRDLDAPTTRELWRVAASVRAANALGVAVTVRPDVLAGGSRRVDRMLARDVRRHTRVVDARRAGAGVKVPFLDLTRGVSALRPELDASVASVLDSGRFVLGDHVAAFEAAFAGYCGTGHAAGVASGTDAVAIALRALGIGPGDEVIVPANTCVPTVVGVEAAGATPVLADVDAATWTLDPASAAAAVTERTRAVVSVHLYGLCADVDALRELGIAVVEDAAQAHGAELHGRRAGSLGDSAAFSFYPTKNLGAFGDAGAVVTADSAVAGLARSLRAYGERERYESVREGWNSRLDELQGALLLAKLSHLDAWTARRRAIAAVYDEAVRGTELVAQLEPEGYLHVRHLYVVRSADRDGFRARLEQRGIETAVHYPRPIHGHPAYAHLDHSGSRRERTTRRRGRKPAALP